MNDHTWPIGQATVVALGTCGELVQGFVDGTHFLVTCPVNLYSRVSVALYPGEPTIMGPKDCPKSRAAVQATLAYLGKQNLAAKFVVCSSLPRGKGMASSSADGAAAEDEEEQLEDIVVGGVQVLEVDAGGRCGLTQAGQ
jgi:uncharacterized protein involved in propanediol utilization